jgi:sulfur transfer complex TusBCD TusB component (DsrH family)
MLVAQQAKFSAKSDHITQNISNFFFSMQINLTPDQFYILEDLIARGMEDKLAPFDNIKVNAEQRAMITENLAAVAFFNSHKITN